MSTEFQSNPVATFMWTYNYKLQFDCRHFYDLTPSVTSSDPLIVPVVYNQAQNYFQFLFKGGFPISLASIILTPMVLAPPVQGGVPFVGPLQNYGLWWASTSTTAYDGQQYPLFTVGAEKNSAGLLARLPDVVMVQIIMNSDYRMRFPSSQATPPSPGPIVGM